MAVTTQGHWFGSADVPLLGWVTCDPAVASGSGVVIVPPMGYEAWSAQRMLRSLAEALAADGHLVLRVDLRGTGDSALDTWQVTSVDEWRADVRAAAAELRALGATRVSIVGLRMGALLALSTADAADADLDAGRDDGGEVSRHDGGPSIVAWWPPASGRAHLRELTLLGERPSPADDPAGGGSVFVAGVAVTGGLAATAARLDVTGDPDAAGRRVVVLDRDDRPPVDALVERLRSAGIVVDHAVATGASGVLDVATEHAVVPADPLTAIATLLRPRRDGISALAADAPARHLGDGRGAAAVLPVGDRWVEEAVVELGPERFVAIETRPARSEPLAADALLPSAGGRTTDRSATVVFLNSGSEHHVGSGRAWVELARRLALEGHRSVRVDYRGWGESPDGGLAPGRPFDPHTVGDTARIVAALDPDHERIVLVGLCAGAWSALREVERLPLAGLLALNPPVYWQPGDPIEATMAETRVRVERERPREERLARWHVWDVADVLRIPVAGARWLGLIARAPFPVWFVCTPDDDGREYLHQRLARPLARARRSPRFRLVELERLDHSMHRQWHRDELLGVLRELLVVATGG